jgi:hypothetical protein
MEGERPSTKTLPPARVGLWVGPEVAVVVEFSNEDDVHELIVEPIASASVDNVRAAYDALGFVEFVDHDGKQHAYALSFPWGVFSDEDETWRTDLSALQLRVESELNHSLKVCQ